jgi:hypothetical protein
MTQTDKKIIDFFNNHASRNSIFILERFWLPVIKAKQMMVSDNHIKHLILNDDKKRSDSFWKWLLWVQRTPLYQNNESQA